MAKSSPLASISNARARTQRAARSFRASLSVNNKNRATITSYKLLSSEDDDSPALSYGSDTTELDLDVQRTPVDITSTDPVWIASSTAAVSPTPAPRSPFHGIVSGMTGPPLPPRVTSDIQDDTASLSLETFDHDVAGSKANPFQSNTADYVQVSSQILQHLFKTKARLNALEQTVETLLGGKEGMITSPMSDRFETEAEYTHVSCNELEELADNSSLLDRVEASLEKLQSLSRSLLLPQKLEELDDVKPRQHSVVAMLEMLQESRNCPLGDAVSGKDFTKPIAPSSDRLHHKAAMLQLPKLDTFQVGEFSLDHPFASYVQRATQDRSSWSVESIQPSAPLQKVWSTIKHAARRKANSPDNADRRKLARPAGKSHQARRTQSSSSRSTDTVLHRSSGGIRKRRSSSISPISAAPSSASSVIASWTAFLSNRTPPRRRFRLAEFFTSLSSYGRHRY